MESLSLALFPDLPLQICLSKEAQNKTKKIIALPIEIVVNWGVILSAISVSLFEQM